MSVFHLLHIFYICRFAPNRSRSLSSRVSFCASSGVARRVFGLATQSRLILKNRCPSRFAAKVIEKQITCSLRIRPNLHFSLRKEKPQRKRRAQSEGTGHRPHGTGTSKPKTSSGQ